MFYPTHFHLKKKKKTTKYLYNLFLFLIYISISDTYIAIAKLIIKNDYEICLHFSFFFLSFGFWLYFVSYDNMYQITDADAKNVFCFYLNRITIIPHTFVYLNFFFFNYFLYNNCSTHYYIKKVLGQFIDLFNESIFKLMDFFDFVYKIVVAF